MLLLCSVSVDHDLSSSIHVCSQRIWHQGPPFVQTKIPQPYWAPERSKKRELRCSVWVSASDPENILLSCQETGACACSMSLTLPTCFYTQCGVRRNPHKMQHPLTFLISMHIWLFGFITTHCQHFSLIIGLQSLAPLKPFIKECNLFLLSHCHAVLTSGWLPCLTKLPTTRA